MSTKDSAWKRQGIEYRHRVCLLVIDGADETMLTTATLIGLAATSNPGGAIEFYRDVLGLRLVEESAFALVLDAGGTMLRIQIVPEVKAPPYTVLGWRVEDMAATVDGLAERGVVFERFPGMEQDARGVWTTPDGAQVAWFRDPEGNFLSLTAS